MFRRGLLLGLVAAVSGCTDRLPAPGGSSTPTPTETATRAAASTRTPTATSRPPPATTTPAPEPLGTAPDDAACPVVDDPDRVVCGPDAPGPMTVRPAPATGDLPATTVTATLTNGASVPLSFSPRGWSLWKRADGRWWRVVAGAPPHAPATLAPDGVHSWSLTVDNGRVDGPPLPRPAGARSLDVAGLGGGDYALVTPGALVPPATEGPALTLAARFRLDGPPAEVRPTSEVTSVDRDGSLVRVVARPRTGDGYRRATAAVERAPDAEGRPVIAEQVLQDRVLRDTLPVLRSGVERVELTASTARTPAFGVAGPTHASFRGETVRVSLAPASR